MSVRSSSAPVRHSPLRIIAGLLLPVVVVAGTALSVRLINGNRALAASDVRNQSTTRDVKSQSTAREIQSQSADGLWSFVAKTDSQAAAKIASAYRSYRKLRLNIDAFTVTLAKAPLESATKSKAAQLIITLPQADGTFMRFAIVESPIMAPELAARYPEIKTYSAQGIDDPAATARFDWTPTGFHAIVLATGGTSLIEPETQGDRGNYLVYSPGDVVVESGECDVSAADQEAAVKRNALLKKSGVTENVSSGSTLRTYRLAAAATAEYTQAYGSGSVSGGLAAITTTINLVDAIYEREVAIRFTLVANNDAIIFTNGATDDYTHENTSLLINENQAKLDGVIGAANYDVGHVFDGSIQGSGFSWQGFGIFAVACL
ncbi:MAG TPA: zinc-dependent metalloprotease family protein, partial [Pyrinomonadaceae bacterium]|nr:zinc-dependent metalloprotease family protein [Pyrinomonadaceae bacterium]